MTTPTRTYENAEPTKLVAITDRAFAFAVRIVNLCKFLEKQSAISRTLINQLLDAATSVGANLEEAVAGQSRADFIHKNAIALKEARESNYWLRLIIATSSFKPSVSVGILELERESSEISKIIAKRIISSKKN
jgi:four helix bundle protein